MSPEMTMAFPFTPDHGHPSSFARVGYAHDDIDVDIRSSSLAIQVLSVVLKLLILISSLPVLVIALIAQRFLSSRPGLQRNVTSAFVAVTILHAAGLVLTILYCLLA